MKLLIKMLGIGLIVAAAITYDRRRLRRLGRLDVGLAGGAGFGDFSDLAGAGDLAPDVEIVAEAVIVGIADVDPEPLASFGEAIDPDAVDDAHRSVRDQRDRLPVEGENIP